MLLIHIPCQDLEAIGKSFLTGFQRAIKRNREYDEKLFVNELLQLVIEKSCSMIIKYFSEILNKCIKHYVLVTPL